MAQPPAYRRGDHVIVAPDATPMGPPYRDGTYMQHSWAGTVTAVTTYPGHPDLPTHYDVTWPTCAAAPYEAAELLPAGPEHRMSLIAVLCPACDRIVDATLPDHLEPRRAAPLVPDPHDCTD